MSGWDDAEIMLAAATVFSNDDDDDIAAALLAFEHHDFLLPRAIAGSDGAERRGSLPGRSPDKLRDFTCGERGVLRDSFGLDGRPPIDDEKDFERRFRLLRILFDRVYRDTVVMRFHGRSAPTKVVPSFSPRLREIAVLRL